MPTVPSFSPSGLKQEYNERAMFTWKSLVKWGLLLAVVIVVPMRRGESPFGYLILFVPLFIVQLWWKHKKGSEWPVTVFVPVFVVWFIVVLVIHHLAHPAF